MTISSKGYNYPMNPSAERRSLSEMGSADAAATGLLQMASQTLISNPLAGYMPNSKGPSQTSNTAIYPATASTLAVNNFVYDLSSAAYTHGAGYNGYDTFIDPSYYYNSGANSDTTGAARGSDVIEEKAFCSDFVCCGVGLPDLHALLQHYEESHVKMEEVVLDPSQQEYSINGGTNNTPSAKYTSPYEYGSYPSNSAVSYHQGRVGSMATPYYPHHPRGYAPIPAAAYRKKQVLSLGIEPQDYAHGSGPDAPLSAFDTTVIRTVSPAPGYQHHPAYYGSSAPYTMPAYYAPVKRPKPAPVSNLVSDPHAISALKAMLPAVVANASDDHQFKLIHSALFSTMNPPGTSAEGRNLSRGAASRQRLATKDGDLDDDPDGTRGTCEGRERPYMCPVAGCGKTYKNPNGLKYHAQHGHDSSGKDLVEKPFRCPFSSCAKRYKNANGLKYHMQHGHPGQTPPSAVRGAAGRQQPSVASLTGIAGLNQIEAALKREQALRAQKAAQASAIGVSSVDQPSAPPSSEVPEN